MTSEISDLVPRDNPGAREIGFAIPENYNAGRILFDNLSHGRGDRLALTGPGGTRTYRRAVRRGRAMGHGFQSLGLKRGDRILMFLDDTPVYPRRSSARCGRLCAAIDQHADAAGSARSSISRRRRGGSGREAEFTSRFNAEACKDTPLQTLIVVNGAAATTPYRNRSLGQQWLLGSPPICPKLTPIATTWRSGCIDPARPDAPRASCICSTTWPIASRRLRDVLELRRHICSSVPKIFFATAWQRHHLPVLGRCGDAAAAWPAEAGNDLRGDREIPTVRVLRIADALHLADQGRRRGRYRFSSLRMALIGRRGALG